ncbi:ThiF family adenylyltransferase [Kitasatospora sp. NPDC004531]
MRPVIKPALSRLWREKQTLQFGTVRRHARLIEGVDSRLALFLGLIDGTRTGPAVVEAGQKLGLSQEYCQGMLDSLGQSELLDDAQALHDVVELYPAPRRDLLGPDVSSLSLVHPAPDEAAAVLRNRARARVEVRGAGRVGAAVATALAAGGIGEVSVLDRGRVSVRDCAPGGFPPGDVGRLRSTAARELVHRVNGAPIGERYRRPPVNPPPPVLVVLAPRDGSGAYTGAAVDAQELMRAGIPHLYTGVLEHLGVVGPLVVPGASACGSCATLARRDQDEAWPRLLAQLIDEGPGRPRAPACDSAVAASVAGLAALHVQLYLDGVLPPSVDGWCELSAADGMVRRLRLRSHPDCGCLWQSAAPVQAGTMA